MPREHILEVWDPAEGIDSMQAHVRVLLNAVKTFRAGRCKEDDVYVWWGHRAPDRGDGFPAAVSRAQAVHVESSRNDPEPETHLYLTDFSSFYVAHLGGVTREDVRGQRDARIPHLYKQHRIDCALWYRLWDVRRLVDRDGTSTARELSKLRSLADGGRPLSLQSGLPTVPLLVTTAEESRYFDPPTRSHFIEDQYWVEFDAERQGIGAIERELRYNRFGEHTWYSYGPLARSFIATGELLWRNHGADPLFDVTTVLIEFAKAVEVKCNALLREVLAGAPGPIRALNVNGQSVDIGDRLLNLDELARFIGADKATCDYLRARLRDGSWFTGRLPAVLSELAEDRNKAAHGREVDWDRVARWRAHLVGVGCLGYLIQLGQVALLNT